MLEFMMHPIVTTSIGVALIATVMAWYFWSVGKDRKILFEKERAELNKEMQHQMSMRNDVIDRLTVHNDKHKAEANEWKQEYEELEVTALSVSDKFEENLNNYREEIRGLKYKNEVLQALVSGVVQSHSIKRPKLASILNNLPERLHDTKKFENILSAILREANKDERL
jgi:flagellar biosynthesis component FlhA